MGCGRLETYRTDVEGVVLIRLHDGRVTSIEILSESGAMVMYDVVLRH